MSGDSPPPKPKPGSLRDRIAAFEQKPQQNAPPPPAPRPKPGHVQWKPRHSSPPPPPVNTGEGAEGRHGMSTADAKESIGAGGMSLKERMAALQGRAAFAAPPPPVPAPKPAGERKWKPPPAPVSLPADNEADADAEPDAPARTTSLKSPVSGNEAEASEGGNVSEAAGDAEKAISPTQEHSEETAAEGAEDPEEEERKRRAAIAARMARLGGARIGMGPPVFAPKPRAPTLAKEERAPPESTEETSTSAAPEKIDIPSAPSESSLLSPESAGSGKSPPASMPVPSGPKRAAPPRRRPPKSPGAPSGELPPLPSEAEKEEGATPLDTAERDEKKLEEDEASAPTAVAKEAEEPQEGEREETEEEAAARRKRIADRIAKSGGINPFAGPRPVQPEPVEGEEEEREEQVAAEGEAHEPETVPAVVRVSNEAPETSAVEAEEQEEGAEVPPRSPSEPDEEPQSHTAQAELEAVESEDVPPPLPSRLTSAEVDEAKEKQPSLSSPPPTALPTKEEEKNVPIVDLSKPSEVGKKDEKLEGVKDVEGDSVDITEAAVEYKDVQTHPANQQDDDEAGAEVERGESPPIPAEKEGKLKVKDAAKDD